MLVAAPTGSGKTIVGEFAVHLALADRAQVLLHHADQGAVQPEVRRPGRGATAPRTVGLLTGDNTVNGEAPVVVMTTEVLRNMLYAGSRTLLGLGFVVMDEVHYLADRLRGAVWEEVIIHLPESVAAGLAVGHGLQRRGVRRVAGDGARRHHHDRGGEAPGAAVPARDGRQADAGPVRVLRRGRRRGLRPRGRTGQRAAGPDRPGRLGQQPAMRDRRSPRKGRPGDQEPAGRRQRSPGVDPRAGSTWSTGSSARDCCRRSSSSSAGSAATPR